VIAQIPRKVVQDLVLVLKFLFWPEGVRAETCDGTSTTDRGSGETTVIREARSRRNAAQAKGRCVVCVVAGVQDIEVTKVKGETELVHELWTKDVSLTKDEVIAVVDLSTTNAERAVAGATIKNWAKGRLIVAQLIQIAEARKHLVFGVDVPRGDD
jgi:hypothetical protein